MPKDATHNPNPTAVVVERPDDGPERFDGLEEWAKTNDGALHVLFANNRAAKTYAPGYWETAEIEGPGKGGQT